MKSLNGAAVVAAWGALAAGGAAHAQEAVQWRVEDGGNGHWYRATPDPERLSWEQGRGAALADGGDLPTAGSQEEWAFLISVILVDLPKAAYVPLGIRQHPDSSEPGGGWYWIDGPGIPIPWGGMNPSDSGTGEDFGHGFRYPDSVIAVNDYTGSLWSSALTQWLCIEWSADCNGDGIVDYGQILDGTFADTNANGVPDPCECLADINDDGTVNGADISVLLGYWGQSGKSVVGDITGDGIVNGADLALLLGSWGPCQ